MFLFITLVCVHLIIINKNNSKLRKMKFFLIFELVFVNNNERYTNQRARRASQEWRSHERRTFNFEIEFPIITPFQYFKKWRNSKTKILCFKREDLEQCFYFLKTNQSIDQFFFLGTISCFFSTFLHEFHKILVSSSFLFSFQIIFNWSKKTKTTLQIINIFKQKISASLYLDQKSHIHCF